MARRCGNALRVSRSTRAAARRRQERTECESQLAAALEDAESARAQVQDARAEAATATAKLGGLEEIAAKLREDLEAATTELASSRERIAALDPCAVDCSSTGSAAR